MCGYAAFITVSSTVTAAGRKKLDLPASGEEPPAFSGTERFLVKRKYTPYEIIQLTFKSIHYTTNPPPPPYPPSPCSPFTLALSSSHPPLSFLLRLWLTVFEGN